MFFPLRLNPFLGLVNEEGDAPLLAESVHIDDVVEGHVKALDTGMVPGEYSNFLLNSDSPTGPVWADAEKIVRRELREEVEKGLVPFAGTLGTSDSFVATRDEPFKQWSVPCLLTYAKPIPLSRHDGWLTHIISAGTIKSKFDATPSERDLLGHPFRPFTEQIKDTTKWYVGLPDE